ncbi:hypothetical protein GGH94_000751 [Coemansia aciculifera]|uniref:Uncharacterized protein n=1 Tax=Coemansia aciculifera TaxID=417176 RepID=A0A9W8M8B9_9FUNG|nr:hypothetical protein GGH94_000751 [Coemansia aciculifera]
MANGKGGAPGLKKKSSRKSKAHGVDMHRTRDGENDADIGVPDMRHTIGQARGGGASIPSAGSSGKQAQMVFTIGTFDDDDDSYISDQLRTTVAASHRQTRLVGARGSVELSKAAEPGSDSHALLDGRVDNSELPASWKGAGLTKPSAAQRLHLKRQTLFTMGSHSEASDMDGGDMYNGTGGRSAYAAYHSASNSNSSVDSSDIADAVVTNNSSGDDHAVPESAVEQRVADGSTISDAGELAVSALNPGTSMAPHDCERRTDCGGSVHNSNKSPAANNDEDGCSSNGLHMCKASTSLSQLGKASDSVSSIDAAASNSTSDQGSSSVGMPERVASAPAIQPAADTQANGSCVSFALCDNREGLETSPVGKGKAALPREGYGKARKRVGSKKAHLKKAVSTAALRGRSRLGGPQRRDPLALKAQVGGATEYDGPADGSYVDYSGTSDMGEDHCQVEVDVQQQQQLAGALQADVVAGADAARVSPHSSTATLDGTSQEMDDSASTASIGSPRAEQSQTFGTNQRAPSADTARVAEQADIAMGENHCDQDRSRVADPPPSSLSVVGDTGAAQAPSDQGTRSVQRVQGEAGESRQGRMTGQSRHGNSFRKQGAGVVSGQTMHVALSTKRNMESQRQQSMVEKEEEDMDIATTLVTGIPRRQNRASGMAPYIYLSPSSPAYSQQVRAMDRTYGHVRAMAHPMLESISRCVALREQRLAFAVPRGQARAWTSRRIPSETDMPGEWWESLMPPPSSSVVANREHRTRLLPAELPPWVLVPDGAKCAVYGPDLTSMVSGSGGHGQLDASCVHVRELREHAKELKYVRQHAVSAPRNQVLTLPRQPAMASLAELETWRGRRVPGLLDVDIYAGAAGPLDPSSRQPHRPGPEPRSPPLTEVSPLPRVNPLAPPYRRYGTVYGYTSANGVSKWPGQAAALPTVPLGGGGQPSAAVALSVRGFNGTPAARASTVGIWDTDPRRSSYFDRLSIDDNRPQLASSAAQTAGTGLLRRVISGLTGATTTAFGTSQ